MLSEHSVPLSLILKVNRTLTPVYATMNDRLARDVELILLVITYVALTSIVCYMSLVLGRSKLVTSAEELMFTQIKYLLKSILSLIL